MGIMAELRKELEEEEEREREERRKKLRAAFEKAEESGCENYPFGDGYFILGSDLKKELEALDMDEEDGFYEDYESIDSLDDDGMYLWADGVYGPYYSFEDYCREAHWEEI